jgi:hypothetical protein
MLQPVLAYASDPHARAEPTSHTADARIHASCHYEHDSLWSLGLDSMLDFSNAIILIIKARKHAYGVVGL